MFDGAKKTTHVKKTLDLNNNHIKRLGGLGWSENRQNTNNIHKIH